MQIRNFTGGLHPYVEPTKRASNYHLCIAWIQSKIVLSETRQTVTVILDFTTALINSILVENLFYNVTFHSIVWF